MNHRSFLAVLLGSTLGLLAPHAGAAAPEAECAPSAQVDPLRLLRQASLDLRGQVPTIDEYRRVDEAPDPSAEVERIFVEMLSSDEYRRFIREYHRGLLWSTVNDSVIPQILNPSARIRPRFPTNIWQVPTRSRVYRGASQVECLDQEQTQFDGQGRPVPIHSYAAPECTGPGANGTCVQEGYVWVEPYWDPQTPIKVCAFDAQAFETGTHGISCGDFSASDPGCGCGPDLLRCGRFADGGDAGDRASLAEEPLRIFEWIVTEDRSYLEAFTTPTTLHNGSVAHYYRWLTGVGDEQRTDLNLVAFDAAAGETPPIDFADDHTWIPVEREAAHAGVLTTFAYLVRFASNRARANRFYTAFYCDPFVPPEDGIPAEGADPSPNLRERDGCDGCHQVLEPAAAHWGRWRNGSTYGLFREDVMSFDVPREECRCGEGTDQADCSPFCQSYFVTADNAHPEEYAQYGGLPISAAWLEPSDHNGVAVGPKALVHTPEQQRRVARCTVRNLATRLLGRPLEADDLRWLEDQTDSLEDDGYRFNGLVRRILADGRYRSIG